MEALACQFRLQDYWPIAVNFLLYDSEYRVRSVGADALARLQSKTIDRRTLGILASVVCDSYEEMLIRRDAYRSMRIVAYGDWQTLSGPNDQPYELDRDADWNFINASINGEQVTVRKEQVLQFYLNHDDLDISLGALEAIDKIYPGDFADFLAYMAAS